MQTKIKYEFTTKMWQHNAPGGWYFVALPKTISKEIREHLKWQEEGWGRMKAVAKIGVVEWDTAIWFDTKVETYILPIKSEIRKKTNLKVEHNFQLQVWV